MNLRLTPLNIISSIALVGIGYILVFPAAKESYQPGIAPLVVLLVTSLISDLIFRRLVVVLKRIWLIELLFIIFVIVLVLLIRTQFN